MSIRPVLVGLALVGALAALPGCASKKTSSGDPAPAAGDAAVDAASAADDWYEEVYKDGRYYVFGQEKTYEAWKQTHHMPYTRTQIGAGPRGETLVFEIDKKNPEWTGWLEEMYAWKHKDDPKPYFSQIERDGRFYVVGSEAMEAKFKKTGHLPYTRTFIAAGPGGKTVVVEVDKKDPGLTDWLVQQFEVKNGPLNR